MLRLTAYAYNGVQHFPMSSGDLLVGSRESCDIVLPYTGVAKEHARLVRRGDQLQIIDLGSRRGILVNGRKVKQCDLEELDEIRIGNITLLVEDIAPRPDHRAAGRADKERGRKPLSLAQHLACVSDWVLSDTSSRTTIDSLIREVLEDLGGGACFLWSGDQLHPGTRFAVSTSGDWLSAGEAMLEELSPQRRQTRGRSSQRLEVTGRVVWLFGRSLHAMGRAYLFAVALPDPGENYVGPEAELSVLADMLVLGLVHHVGRFEPILPGHAGQGELVLAPGLVVGPDSAMAQALDIVRVAANTSARVLFRGEPGSGRGLLAETLHRSGPRREGPFAVVECEGASSAQLDAELFGGEVTGKRAPVRREGMLKLSDGGTLVLADVDALPLELQIKLVRFLRTGIIESPGESRLEISVTVLATSRGPLETLVAADRFRVDLAYRLCQFAVDVPPLRDRVAELPLLLQASVNRFSHESGKRVQGVTVRALSALAAYEFPGNLQELENLVRQMVYLCPAGEPMDLPLLPKKVRVARVRSESRVDRDSELNLRRLIGACERSAIHEALRRSGGNRSQAARLLGLSRNGLAAKIERYSDARG